MLAESILRAGKGINFLRDSCGDAAWVQARAAAGPAAAAAAGASDAGAAAALGGPGGGGGGQVEALERDVARATREVDARLMDVLRERQGLARHCDALRRYVLLGQVGALRGTAGGLVSAFGALGRARAAEGLPALHAHPNAGTWRRPAETAVRGAAWHGAGPRVSRVYVVAAPPWSRRRALLGAPAPRPLRARGVGRRLLPAGRLCRGAAGCDGA
mgnify:CR=1 FL=1